MTENATEKPMTYKIIVVGDGMCGKTSLIRRIDTGKYNEQEYVPTVFDLKMIPFRMKGYPKIDIEMWDSAGQEDYDRLRPIGYMDSHLTLVCFAVNNIVSFKNCRDKWIPEVDHFCYGKGRILVGCKSDMRTNASNVKETFVSREEAQHLAAQINAEPYIECSSRMGDNVMTVFTQAVTKILKRYKKSTIVSEKPKKRRKKICRCF